MGRLISAKNKTKQSARDLRTKKVLCETLEERQLMSLTLEVRGTDGSASANVTTVGQVINLQLLGIVTAGTVGSDDQDVSTSTPATFGINDVFGSFQSSAVDQHAVGGNITNGSVSMNFRSFGYQPGVSQDINGDGFIDLGGNDPQSANGKTQYILARSSATYTGGTTDSTSNTILLGTFSYTVQTLAEGGETAIDFVQPPSSPGNYTLANWYDGVKYFASQGSGFIADPDYATLIHAAPFVVSDSAIIPAPIAVDDTGVTAYTNTPTTINELANDNVVQAPNPASVVVASAASHGTTSVNTDGSILYTPANGYTGTDSFTYNFADRGGRRSNTATVSINVTLPPPPTAAPDTATTLRGQPVTITVASNDTSFGTITPSTVAVATAPTNGAAVAQSDGSILYTPAAGFVGTDTFTYTIADSTGQTSSPGTVTVTVNTPVPPVAANDTFTTSEGAPLSLSVLSNDTSQSSTIAPSTVAIVTTVLHGTTTVNSDGTVLYTPAGGYIGNDSFTYTVADALGDVSNQATVSLIVTAGVPPVANNLALNALTDQANTLNALAAVSGGAALVPGTLTLVGTAGNGTVVTNTDGTFTYTPTAGFVGSDSFTFTIGDVNGNTSNVATANVFVGTVISNAKGSTTRSISFTDAAGGLQTVMLNSGTADVYFSGIGTIAVAKNGRATITGGTSLQIGSIALAGTSKASSLSIKGSVKTPVTVGGITDSSPLGSIAAQSATLGGTIALNSVGTLQAASIANAVITIGSGLPGRVAITSGAVTNSALTSAVPITSLKVSSWNNSFARNGFTPADIIAPSIASLVVAGAFNPQVSLTLANAGKVLALGAAKIGGALGGSLTTTSTGNVGSISAGSAGWAGTVNNLKSFTVKTGGFASLVTAASIGSLMIGGDMTGSITAVSAGTIKVTGGVSGSTLSFSGAAGLKSLTVSGAITNETITSVGNIGTITAGSMSGSNISAGVTAGTTITNVTAAALGAGVITSVKVAGKAATFANTNILASKINAASLGAVTTGNGGVTFGLATKLINSFAGIFANGPVHLGHAQLLNNGVLATYLTQQSVVFGDFAIQIQS